MSASVWIINLVVLADVLQACLLVRSRMLCARLPGEQAGYADGQILPIEHPVWRFYRRL